MTNLVSFHFNRTAYNKANYKTRVIGTSDCNMFLPFYSLFAHEMMLFEDDTRVIEYALPSEPQDFTSVRQYSRMFSTLRTASCPTKYNYKLRGEDYSINMHRGLLYKRDIVYVCLGIEKDYVLSTPMEQIASTPDVTKFTLFVDNAFENEAVLKNIRKKVIQEYITPLKEQGVDVVYTSRMNNWLFRNNYVQPKFKSVTEMMKHLKEEVPKTLIT